MPFLVLGGLLGFAVAAFVAYGLPGDESFDRSAVFGFFLVMFGAGGVILGAVVALVLDRLSVRSAKHAVVEAVPDSVPDDGDAERRAGPQVTKPAAEKSTAHREIIDQWHAAMENFLMIFSLAKKALRTHVASSGSGLPVKK